MDFTTIMGWMLPGAKKNIISPYYRIGDAQFQPGEIHGGIDFQFDNSTQNVGGVKKFV